MKPRPRVLVVDDCNEVRRALARRFRQLDCEVVESAHGQQALHTFADTELDLVVLDYSMPDLTGAQVLAGIRASNPHIPVIMFTAHVDDDDVVHELRELGATAVLTKTETALLMYEIERALRRTN